MTSNDPSKLWLSYQYRRTLDETDGPDIFRPILCCGFRNAIHVNSANMVSEHFPPASKMLEKETGGWIVLYYTEVKFQLWKLNKHKKLWNSRLALLIFPYLIALTIVIPLVNRVACNYFCVKYSKLFLACSFFICF